MRPSGSAGGHNGLRSIEAQLSTQKFPRLRIGVGAPEHSRELAEHVLARFSAEERPLLTSCIARAADAVERVVELGVEAARALVNARTPRAETES